MRPRVALNISQMHKFISLFFFLIALPLFGATPTVLVTVAPHKFFVEHIAGDTVSVLQMVPTGASSHTYEPTPKEMISASQATLWFCIGEPFEQRAIAALKSHCPSLAIINLQQGLDLIAINQEKQSCHCCKGSVDLHFWLSCRQGKIQAKTISDALSRAFPEHEALYTRNLAAFQERLEAADNEIKDILTPLKQRAIFVSHPAYAYFCRDYQLEQYSIEVEGKDPTPQQMTQLLLLAKQLEIKTIFVQQQYSNKGARLFGDTIGAQIKTLNPYSEHYFSSLFEIAHAFAKQ